MKFLLTNDDGIEAPGIAALEAAVKSLGDYHVVAPEKHYSGCGHQVTAHQPLTLREIDSKHAAIDGTPADCTRIALTEICPDVDVVLAGINEGGNLGWDVYASGTVAAVREAAFLGKTGIAISHYRAKNRSIDWNVAAEWTTKIVKYLLNQRLPVGAFWNVNLPHLIDENVDQERLLDQGLLVQEIPEMVPCRVDTHPMPVSYRQDGNEFRYSGVYQERSSHPESDVLHCFSGKITLSVVSIDPNIPAPNSSASDILTIDLSDSGE